MIESKKQEDVKVRNETKEIRDKTVSQLDDLSEQISQVETQTSEIAKLYDSKIIEAQGVQDKIR